MHPNSAFRNDGCRILIPISTKAVRGRRDLSKTFLRLPTSSLLGCSTAACQVAYLSVHNLTSSQGATRTPGGFSMLQRAPIEAPEWPPSAVGGSSGGFMGSLGASQTLQQSWIIAFMDLQFVDPSRPSYGSSSASLGSFLAALRGFSAALGSFSAALGNSLETPGSSWRRGPARQVLARSYSDFRTATETEWQIAARSLLRWLVPGGAW